MKKLIIFDLDGTLLNTVKDLNAALNYALTNNGFETKSVEHTAKAIGNGISKTIWRSLPEGTSQEDHDKCFSDFRKYYRVHYLVNTIPYEGMKETLIKLKERGYHFAVATNKLHSIACDLIEHFFPNLFDLVQGESPEIEAIKPNPAMMNHVLNTLGFSNEEAVYVGDSEVDIETAKNAHTPLILANYGFHRSPEFLQNKSAPHIDTPSDLLEILL